MSMVNKPPFPLLVLRPVMLVGVCKDNRKKRYEIKYVRISNNAWHALNRHVVFTSNNNRAVSLIGRASAFYPGDWGSNPDRVIPKTNNYWPPNKRFHNYYDNSHILKKSSASTPLPSPLVCGFVSYNHSTHLVRCDILL